MGWGNLSVKKYTYKSKAEKLASDMFSDAITQDEEEDYTPQLRGSSLPICIMLHAKALLEPYVRPKPARLDQYSEFGTVAHELFQKKMTHSKKWGKFMFGDWECPNLKCLKVHYTFCNRPRDYKTHVCECGRIGLRYRELETRYKGVIGIHVDTVLKFSDDKIWVWEYKTTGSFKIKDEKLKFKPKHFNQACAYPIILNEEFQLQAEKFFIAYVNRDAPQFSATSQRQHRFFPFSAKSEIVVRQKEKLDAIVAGEKARVRYFKNPTLKNLKALDALRPCKSKADYHEDLLGMVNRYEPSESCPYAKVKGGCFGCGDKLSGVAVALQKAMVAKV